MKKSAIIAITCYIILNFLLCVFFEENTAVTPTDVKERLRTNLDLYWGYIEKLERDEAISFEVMEEMGDCILNDIDVCTTYWLKKEPVKSREVDSTAESFMNLYYGVVNLYYMDESEENGCNFSELKLMYEDVNQSLGRWF